MSVSVSLANFIIETLRADAGVSNLVGAKIYDEPPAIAQLPYITMGPVDGRLDDADCIEAREETIQIDCWTSANGQKWPCKKIVDAVIKALRNMRGEIADGFIVGSRIELYRIVDDPDGTTVHGVVQITAMIDEAYEDG